MIILRAQTPVRSYVAVSIGLEGCPDAAFIEGEAAGLIFANGFLQLLMAVWRPEVSQTGPKRFGVGALGRNLSIRNRKNPGRDEGNASHDTQT